VIDVPSVTRTTATLVLLVLLVSCRAEQPPEPYAGLNPTKEAAAQAVVDALAAGDVARLTSLAITDVEFRKNIYPELPASDPEVGMPADYLWADTNLKSRGQLAETLEEHDGRRLAVESVRFAGRSTDYDRFRVHSDTRLTVRDEAGQRREVRLFGSMIETPSGWKVYSYIVD
jgi:hypothetical protein